MLGSARLAQAVGHVVGHHARGHQHALGHQLLRVDPHRLEAPVRAALAARALDRPQEHQAPRRPKVARLRVAVGLAARGDAAALAALAVACAAPRAVTALSDTPCKQPYPKSSQTVHRVSSSFDVL